MFKHSADRLPVTLILSLSALDFLVYFTVEAWWLLVGWWLLLILPKASICAWNHHHQHALTFRAEPLNRLLEFFYALHTGATTNLWVLHHVLGHHHNFLDQARDESRWKRKDGTNMGELEYTLDVALTAYYRGYQVGKRYPKVQRKYLLYTAITFAAVALLVAWRPLQGLLVFVLPMCTSLLMTSWTTYGHHSGLDTQNQFEASYNNLNRWYNVFTGNLGYHTAHHYRQGVHWSKLPQLHAEIQDQIPAHLYVDHVVAV